jgi:hypothetical protein
MVLESETVTRNSSHYKGTGDKDELMNFKGSVG